MVHTFLILIITLFSNLLTQSMPCCDLYYVLLLTERYSYQGLSALDELKSITIMIGEQCVMTAGTKMLLRWSADSWAVDDRLYAYFSHGAGQIWLDEVQCTGSETYLTNCSNSGHDEDVVSSVQVGLLFLFYLFW